jgi:hypothetical protein
MGAFDLGFRAGRGWLDSLQMAAPGTLDILSRYI